MNGHPYLSHPAHTIDAPTCDPCMSVPVRRAFSVRYVVESLRSGRSYYHAWNRNDDDDIF